jgi:hypothetical protein
VSEALRQDLAKRTCALYSADPDLDRPTPAPPQVTPPPSPQSVVPGADGRVRMGRMGRMGAMWVWGCVRTPARGRWGCTTPCSYWKRPSANGRAGCLATPPPCFAPRLRWTAPPMPSGTTLSLYAPRVVVAAAGGRWWLVVDPRTDRCRRAVTTAAAAATAATGLNHNAPNRCAAGG